MDEIKFEVVNNETETVTDKLKRELKRFGKGVKDTASDIWQFAKNNKEDIKFYAPMIIAALGGIKCLSKGTRHESERERIDTTYYDPRTGVHWRLRRTPTNAERAELVRRQRLGEFTEDILDDMRLMR